MRRGGQFFCFQYDDPISNPAQVYSFFLHPQIFNNDDVHLLIKLGKNDFYPCNVINLFEADNGDGGAGDHEQNADHEEEVKDLVLERTFRKPPVGNLKSGSNHFNFG